MHSESEKKLLKEVSDACSTGQPFQIETLQPDDIARFTLAATAYQGMKEPIRLRDYQINPSWRVVESVIGSLGLEIVAMFARQSGKTTSLPGATLHFLCSLPSIYEPMSAGFRAGMFGPKKQQADYAFNMFKFFLDTNFLHDMLGIKQVVNNSTEVRLSNGARVYSESASTNAAIEGLTLDLAFIEEAQNVDDTRILNSIYPMCASTNGTRVLTGSPTPERLGYFHQASSRPSKDVFISPWQNAAKYSKKYETFVKKEMRRHGPNSDYFKTQFELQWVTLNASFCTMEELIQLRSGGLVHGTDIPCVAGLDPARINDSSVLTVMALTRIPHICLWYESHGDKYQTQADDVATILKNFPNLEVLNIDAFGGGLAIADLMPETIPIARINMNTATQTKMWSLVREGIVGKRFTYPDVGEVERYRFEEQMSLLQAKQVGGVFKVKAPDGKQYHDDYADSLALAYYAAASIINTDSIFGEGDFVKNESPSLRGESTMDRKLRPGGFSRPTIIRR